MRGKGIGTDRWRMIAGPVANNGLWVVTIFDCLVTYPEHAERARQIMVEAFDSVGVRPTIKTTVIPLECPGCRWGGDPWLLGGQDEPVDIPNFD